MAIEENRDANLSGDPYENFRALLQQSVVFPTTYTFKFIVKAEEEKIIELESIFVGTPAKITVTNSSTGKYRSFTVKVQVQDEEEVINYYKEVSKIDSVIML
ncbi:hypothetical protein SAMN05660909_01256 [Chitinophaga terrae (ex Kim and Jung 2007)]|jgi:putative lipoic acid-binding regulatory protein|uniref:DUF493 domain-containing protein n=1 Tax=Chitinophaga terrae (ex Kim and Jung 2007) TaxID=408074 RepID=A0A1H3ZJR6_9BACT|nr:DUF493 domain-containing protein [Chitinophaga terrae (ex Kim and Jung 2007)]MDQ0107380.1 putative lipoic acid-binding regulatory protein [Chitinophaga terrae (ex Kim and Jung 2007)]GEP88785.1 DUF493 domain-containing protein [Chitinophaga terrae (ex Kim and Jung 2007)]SEA23905.1 hypothetical protein SAMN05660909_01256 [Chitinophaga terrae (ex Kim and Jung 2007)]